MIFLDTLTQPQILWVMVAMQCLIFGVMWLVMARMPHYMRRAASYIGRFNLLVAGNLLLVGLRGYLPDGLTTAPANVLGLWAFVSLWQGVLALEDNPTPAQQNAVRVKAVFGGASAVIVLCALHPAGALYRVAVFYAAIAVLILFTWQMSRQRLARLHGQGLSWVVTAMAWLMALLLLGRAWGGVWLGWDLEVHHPQSGALWFAYLVLALITLLNSLLAFVVVHKSLMRLDDLSRRDTLTELLNRRGFNEELARCWAVWKRQGQTFAVACCDIDHFKTVNDRFGHQAGDEVLVQVAHTLARHIRPGDRLARTGGEEFVLLLAQAPAHELEALANRLRDAVAQAVFAPDGSPVYLSLGLALSLPGDERGDAVVSRADEALYRAKDRGRNRVEVAAELLGRAPGH